VTTGTGISITIRNPGSLDNQLEPYGASKNEGNTQEAIPESSVEKTKRKSGLLGRARSISSEGSKLPPFSSWKDPAKKIQKQTKIFETKVRNTDGPELSKKRPHLVISKPKDSTRKRDVVIGYASGQKSKKQESSGSSHRPLKRRRRIKKKSEVSKGNEVEGGHSVDTTLVDLETGKVRKESRDRSTRDRSNNERTDYSKNSKSSGSLDFPINVRRRGKSMDELSYRASSRPENPLMDPKIADSLPPRHSITIQSRRDAPYLDWIRKGVKRAEGRVNSKHFSKLRVGDSIQFHNRREGILCRIDYLHTYKTFEEMVEREGAVQLTPQVRGSGFTERQLIERSVRVYRGFPGSDRVKRLGALAIGVTYLCEYFKHKAFYLRGPR